jgi:hypothetical protein
MWIHGSIVPRSPGARAVFPRYVRVVGRGKLVACIAAVGLSVAGVSTIMIARASHDVEVQLPTEGRAISATDRAALQEIADATLHDAQAVLPTLPKRLSFEVQLGKSVIPETGETATAVPPAGVIWTVDPDRDLSWIIRTQLRPSLFHELHHLVRDEAVPRRSLMDHVVAEGMATAFERDMAKVDPPWGKPPPETEVMEWTRELLTQPESAPTKPWLIQHPDGRRWIGMRTGTFLVDRATKKSGRTAAGLASISTNEVLGLADIIK